MATESLILWLGIIVAGRMIGFTSTRVEPAPADINFDNLYARFQFNGYAKEIKGRGNVVVGLDLRSRKVVWRSRALVSNGGLLLY